jgi:hypothetical protein
MYGAMHDYPTMHNHWAVDYPMMSDAMVMMMMTAWGNIDGGWCHHDRGWGGIINRRGCAISFNRRVVD